MDAETLRQWIDDGEDLTVLDVGPQEEWADWSIPGSIHADAHEALRAHDPHALDSVRLPKVTLNEAGIKPEGNLLDLEAGSNRCAVG